MIENLILTPLKLAKKFSPSIIVLFRLILARRVTNLCKFFFILFFG